MANDVKAMNTIHTATIFLAVPDAAVGSVVDPFCPSDVCFYRQTRQEP